MLFGLRERRGRVKMLLVLWYTFEEGLSSIPAAFGSANPPCFSFDLDLNLVYVEGPPKPPMFHERTTFSHRLSVYYLQ